MSEQRLTESQEKMQHRISRRESRPDSAQSFHGDLHSPILQLQRMLGNRNVAKLIQAKRLTPEGKIIDLQRKLTVGAADDQYEQEADRVARQVMNTPNAVASHSVQRAISAEEDKDKMLHTKPLATSITPFMRRQMVNDEESEDKEKPVQAKFLTEMSKEPLQRQSETEEEETEPIQAKSADALTESFEAGADVETQISQSKGHGSPLPDSVRSYMEPRFGADFSQVRVHTDAAAQQSAQTLNANAYTLGQNIVFGTGRFAPETQEGGRLLAHELTHVVQQSAQGSARIVQRQMCTDILNAEEVPGVTRGVEVERLVRVDLITQLGAQNIVWPLTIPGASSRLYRMEDCGGFQTTQPPGQGFPDSAFRRYPQGRTVELAEVKIGTWPCLDLAETQVDNYVKLADENEAYKRQLGVDNFELMPTSRFTPSQLQTADGTPVNVGWCSPGVIVYKAVASDDKEEDEEPKDKEPKDKEPGPSESLPGQLLKLGGELLPILAAAGLLEIALAMAGVLGSLVSSPLVALAAVVLGIAFFWDKLEWLGSKVAEMARWVWDSIAGLADLVRGKLTWILGKLSELGIKLAELGIKLAGKIAWLAGKLAEGLTWIAGKIAAGGRWVGRKIASAAKAIWDWLTGSDVEPMVPNIEMPAIEEPTQHCATVAYEDTIIKLDADLLFPFNEGELRKEADAPLNDAAKKIRRMLQKDDWIRFEGYTDNIGSDKYNQPLSEQRARAVASWFVEHGVVPMSRVRTKGYGKTMARANDEEGRKKDRRVDIWLPKHGGTKTVCW